MKPQFSLSTITTTCRSLRSARSILYVPTHSNFQHVQVFKLDNFCQLDVLSDDPILAYSFLCPRLSSAGSVGENLLRTFVCVYSHRLSSTKSRIERFWFGIPGDSSRGAKTPDSGSKTIMKTHSVLLGLFVCASVFDSALSANETKTSGEFTEMTAKAAASEMTPLPSNTTSSETTAYTSNPASTEISTIAPESQDGRPPEQLAVSSADPMTVRTFETNTTKLTTTTSSTTTTTASNTTSSSEETSTTTVPAVSKLDSVNTTTNRSTSIESSERTPSEETNAASADTAIVVAERQEALTPVVVGLDEPNVDDGGNEGEFSETITVARTVVDITANSVSNTTTAGGASEHLITRSERQKKEDHDELRLKIALGVVIPVFALLFIAGIIALMKHRNEKGVMVLVEQEEGTLTYPKPAILIR